MVEKYTGARALLYARVSTDDKDQDPETQVRMMEQWCREREVTIVEIFREKQSAGDTKRPQWRALMGTIFEGDEGITMVVARDESRISRDVEDMNLITKRRGERGVLLRYVSSASTPETGIGNIISHISTWQGEEERRKLKANTKSGMKTRQMAGQHCGRPAKFAFAEDLEDSADGRIVIDPNAHPSHVTTKIYTEETIYSFARAGKSISWVARKVLGISPSAFIAELKQREENPSIRYNKDGEPVEYYRFKGTKDRFSVYTALYEEAIGVRKGDCSERVGNPDGNRSERGEL